MMRKHSSTRAKKIATVIVVGGMLFIFLFDIAVNLLIKTQEARYPLQAESFDFIGDGGNRIHFLNTGNSDCVLLESGGQFALIDSGWGSDNPIKASRKPGYEQRVLEYLKRVAADETGTVTLAFVLPSHYHYDHAGGFPGIFADPAINVEQVYLHPLLPKQRIFERHWNIPGIRQSLEEVSTARGFPIAETLPDKPFRLGAMTLQFFNTGPQENLSLRGENDNSIVTLITVQGQIAGQTALLTGDITANSGLEKQIAVQVSKAIGGAPLDLLKIPHHGYAMSTSAGFLAALKPKAAVVTNDLGRIYPNVKWNLALVSKTATISSVYENGVIAHFGSDGKCYLTTSLHLAD